MLTLKMQKMIEASKRYSQSVPAFATRLRESLPKLAENRMCVERMQKFAELTTSCKKNQSFKQRLNRLVFGTPKLNNLELRCA